MNSKDNTGGTQITHQNPSHSQYVQTAGMPMMEWWSGEDLVCLEGIL